MPKLPDTPILKTNFILFMKFYNFQRAVFLLLIFTLIASIFFNTVFSKPRLLFVIYTSANVFILCQEYLPNYLLLSSLLEIFGRKWCWYWWFFFKIQIMSIGKKMVPAKCLIWIVMPKSFTFDSIFLLIYNIENNFIILFYSQFSLNIFNTNH